MYMAVDTTVTPLGSSYNPRHIKRIYSLECIGRCVWEITICFKLEDSSVKHELESLTVTHAINTNVDEIKQHQFILWML